ncbi:hypothetical protein B4096_0500 [Heyndrickxia coagulans]|uniref:Uncharacterized protein n=1 Tax=Heyndrickxia coagulans TaxID=1398 RepID=A0A150KG59_HEYCO|nr:hypothetical protein B4099_0639 [Heyndrickxia coagulans]KYC81854.1 hypothetical protein B4096_0500 [Heyndrickxia coagulans]
MFKRSGRHLKTGLFSGHTGIRAAPRNTAFCAGIGLYRFLQGDGRMAVANFT